MNRVNQFEKQRLRAEVGARVGAMSPAQVSGASDAVCDRLNALPEWRRALAHAGKKPTSARGGRSGSGVMLFVPGTDEPDITPLAHEVLVAARLALPRVTDWSAGTMDAAWVNTLRPAPAGDIEESRFGVRQPAPHCPAADLARVDLCVVPGRAFDKLCNRLGRGGGFYDVLLRRAVFAGPQGRAPNTRPVLVGVCFDEQVVERVPVDELDVPLDIVVTPTTTYRRL
jgi:5-formyltetrahydrofolate cyclo-ligase